MRKILILLLIAWLPLMAWAQTKPAAGDGTLPLLGRVALASLADESTTLEYTYKGQTLMYQVASNGSDVTVASGNTPTGDVTIPATITVGGKTYSVTGLEARAFYHASAMTSITIESTSITEIATSAFSGCSALASVNAPSVVLIGEYAFLGCTALESFAFPQGVRILSFAFSGCTGLKSVVLDAAEIGSQAFYGCTGLRTATIKSEVIGNQAFRNCSGLSETHLNSVPLSNALTTTLSNKTFEGCTGTLYIDCALTFNLSFTTSSGPFLGSCFEEVNVNSSYVPANLFYNQQFVRRINLTGATTIAGNPAPSCYSLGAYNIEGSSSLSSYEGCIYSSNLMTLQYVPAGQHCIIVNGSCTSITAYIDSNKTHYMDITALAGHSFTASRTCQSIPNVIIREGDNHYASNFYSGTKFISSRPRFDVDGNNVANAQDVKSIVNEALKEK